MESKNMYDSIEKYLTSEKEPEKYDFSNDGACNAYTSILEKEILKKYFTYMCTCTRSRFEKEEKYPLFESGKNHCLAQLNIYGKMIDPDSESLLLQKIYCRLWGISDNLRSCISIQGETLNSVNTTLNVAYKFVESTEQCGERKNMTTKGGRTQDISIKYLLCRYFESSEKMTEQLSKINGLDKFLSIYHTLGNFMPVPSGCNGPRGKGKLQDYWDLTLWRIYEYYAMTEESDRIFEIVGEKKSLTYKEWLNMFVDKNRSNTKSGRICGWKNFIEQNYLQAYVKEDEKGVPIPIELWDGHLDRDENNNFIHILPEGEEAKTQCEQYFTNAYNCIIARGEDMVKILKKEYPNL